MPHIKSELEKRREDEARRLRIAAFQPRVERAMALGRRKRRENLRRQAEEVEKAQIKHLGELLCGKGLLEAGVEYSQADLQRIYRESQV